jgi:hypothetical protein
MFNQPSLRPHPSPRTTPRPSPHSRPTRKNSEIFIGAFRKLSLIQRFGQFDNEAYEVGRLKGCLTLP